MTSFNAFVRQDAVHVVTDGIATNFGVGELVPGRLHKVFPMPAARAVMVVRGVLDVVSGLRCSLDLAGGDLDAMAARIPEHLRHVRDITRRAGGDESLARDVDVFLAGWSPEHDEFCVYMCSGIERPGVPTGIVHRMQGAVTPPLAEPIDLADQTEDVERLARRVHAAQCAGSYEIQVGGFCQLTSVYRDRIVTRIL